MSPFPNCESPGLVRQGHPCGSRDLACLELGVPGVRDPGGGQGQVGFHRAWSRIEIEGRGQVEVVVGLMGQVT